MKYKVREDLEEIRKKEEETRIKKERQHSWIEEEKDKQLKKKLQNSFKNWVLNKSWKI